MSTPTTLMSSFFAATCIISPTAPGVGIMGTSVHAIRFLYPGACAITCSKNRFWISSLAGPRFSLSSKGRRLSVIFNAVLSFKTALTLSRASLLPAYITGSWKVMPSRGLGLAAPINSANSTTCETVPPSVPPDNSIISGRRSLILSIFS